MPAIVAKSISILSDAGLGMAMFSLGMYVTYNFTKKSQDFLVGMMMTYRYLVQLNLQVCSWLYSQESLLVGNQ